jgi:hypothetical protein
MNPYTNICNSSGSCISETRYTAPDEKNYKLSAFHALLFVFPLYLAVVDLAQFEIAGTILQYFEYFKTGNVHAVTLLKRIP